MERLPLFPSANRQRLAADHYAALATGHETVPVKATALSVSPDDLRIAFTGVMGDGGRRACVLDTTTGRLHLASEDGTADTSAPTWSPDGTRIAWVVDGDGKSSLHIGTWSATAPFIGDRHQLPAGAVEYLAWSPDGTRILVGLADLGATLSDAFGSGRVPRPIDDDQTWRPILSPQHDGEGLRRALMVDLTSGALDDLLPGQTVWQSCWAGDHAIVCLTSEDPDESGWYTADLVVVDLNGGHSETLPHPGGQLARPVADPTGQRIAVVAGRMSDRGLDSGDLLILDRKVGNWQPVDTHGVDVSDPHWIGPAQLRYAGLRRLTTVIAEHCLDTGSTTVLWQSAETCGDPVPEFGAIGDTTAVVLHGYLRPPAIALVEQGTAHVRLNLAGPRSAEITSRSGTIRTVAWESVDGTTIDGLVTMPAGDGPFPLVVEVHGGPVWAWRNGWMADDVLTPLLVAGGYAVFHPNIRGSSGRGQEFVRAGLEDMCGELDVADLITGVRHVVDLGLADANRVAVSGLSYGGLMAAWMVTKTDMFAASISRSPVTDWVSQHYASNLPGFDRLAMTGDPLDPASPYRARSPLYGAAHTNTPVLLIAGAQDLATPPEQAAMFHRALREHGVDSELVIYPNEGHGVLDPRALVDHGARVLDFLDRRLGPETTIRKAHA